MKPLPALTSGLQVRDEVSIRINHQPPLIPVEGHPSSGSQIQHPGGLDDGGDASLRCQDRGVAGASATLRDESQHKSGIHGGCLCGSQILGDDDAGLGELRNPRCWPTQQNSLRAGPDITQVRDPLGEVATQLDELLGIELNGRVQSVRWPVAGQRLLDSLHQTRITGHHHRSLHHRPGIPLQGGCPMLQIHGNRLQRGLHPH